MPAAGYKLFVTGDVLTAAQVNDYLMLQTVMVFANSAARTSALSGVLAEGLVSYLKDTDVVEIYTGAAWVSLDDPNAIQNSIVDAKGDLIAASADNTPARLAVGTNGQTLVADSSTVTGLKWATASSTSPYLAYTQVTAGNSTTSSTYQDVTSATITFTAPASGKVKLSIEASMWATGGNQDMYVAFRESSTTIMERTTGSITNASEYRRTISGVVTGISAGSHTYKISIKSGNATYTTGIASIANSPVLLTVEAID